MTTLLLAEVHNGHLNDATAKALTAASAISAPCISWSRARAMKPRRPPPSSPVVEKVLTIAGDAFGHGMAESLADLIVSLAPNYDAIVAPATSTGKNVLPRVAALLDVAQVSEISKVVSSDTFERPIYAGNAVQTVQATDAKKVITVRTSTFAATAEGGSAAIEAVSAPADSVSRASRARRWPIRPARADFGENHHFRRPRHAERRKFQDLYRAGRRQARSGHGRIARGRRRRLCAQRLAGRTDRQGRGAGALYRRRHFRRDPASRRHEGFRKVIVAINKDEDAPIFQVADYGLVADLYSALPELTAELTKLGR